MKIRPFGILLTREHAQGYFRLRAVLRGKSYEICKFGALRTSLLSWPSGAVVLTNSSDHIEKVVTVQLLSYVDDSPTRDSDVYSLKGLSSIKSRSWRLVYRLEGSTTT